MGSVSSNERHEVVEAQASAHCAGSVTVPAGFEATGPMMPRMPQMYPPGLGVIKVHPDPAGAEAEADGRFEGSTEDGATEGDGMLGRPLDALMDSMSGGLLDALIDGLTDDAEALGMEMSPGEEPDAAEELDSGLAALAELESLRELAAGLDLEFTALLELAPRDELCVETDADAVEP